MIQGHKDLYIWYSFQPYQVESLADLELNDLELLMIKELERKLEHVPKTEWNSWNMFLIFDGT